MKKLILVFAAITFTAGAFAQTDSINRKMDPREMNHNETLNIKNNLSDQLHPDGVMMQDGKIMKIEKGEMTALLHDMTMGNGIKVLCDGSYTNQEGIKTKMEEGQHLDMEGNLTIVTTNRDFKENEKRNDNIYDETYLDGVMMQNGIIMLVKDGQMTILDREMTMGNGIKFMTDGNYLKEDGTKMMIEEGQHLDLAGNLTFINGNKDKNMYLMPRNE